MINPLINNKKVLAIYLSAWVTIAFAQLMILFVQLDIAFNFALYDSLVYNFIYLALGFSFWYTAKYNSLENYSTLKILANHLVASIIVSALWVFAGYFALENLFGPTKSYQQFLDNSLVWRLFIGILFYLFIVAIEYAVIYYNNFQDKVYKEVELNALVKEAELKSLKYQINPHFIFNSLNSISALTLSDPAKAQEMTIKLSSFLRATLSKNETQKNKLSEELKNAKLYLDIEKVRFDEKFKFIEEIKTDCMNMEVPSMILQPLFENAVKHGVYESIDEVRICLLCQQQEDYMKITVENNFDPESVSNRGEGIGLKNIKNRLKLIYNQDNLITVEKTENIFRVNLFIPLANKEIAYA